MNEDDLNRLDVGDIVRHAHGGSTYVVTGNYGGRVTAVRTVDLTNSPEWNIVAKAHQTFQETYVPES